MSYTRIDRVFLSTVVQVAQFFQRQIMVSIPCELLWLLVKCHLLAFVTLALITLGQVSSLKQNHFAWLDL